MSQMCHFVFRGGVGGMSMVVSFNATVRRCGLLGHGRCFIYSTTSEHSVKWTEKTQ